MSQYWIPHHVHVCISGDGVIWFDVRRDRYFGTSSAEMHAASALVHGWPTTQGARTTSDDEHAHGLLESLESRGLLTRDAAQGKPAAQMALPSLPEQALIPDDFIDVTPIRWHHVACFLVACAATFFCLRIVSLSFAIASVRWCAMWRKSACTDADTQTARELVSVFNRLRSRMYSAELACLFDSLVQMLFLLAYRIRPTLVIGVAPRPFRAHCWLQHGNIVFNSEPTFSRSFAPILTI